MQTTFRKNIIMAACLALVVSACGTNNDSEEEATIMPITVSGSVAYRERIALTPGYTLKVTLSDVSQADSVAPVVAETSRVLENEQVPLAFEIEVNSDKLLPDHQYQVRAVLHDEIGDLAWTTDSAYPVDTVQQNQDLGRLQLVRVDRSDEQSSQAGNALAGTSWQVEDVAGGGVIDPTSGKPVLYTVQAAEKTYADFKITLTSAGGHSSEPDPGKNPIYRLSRALDKIAGYQFPAQSNDIRLVPRRKRARLGRRSCPPQRRAPSGRRR